MPFRKAVLSLAVLLLASVPQALAQGTDLSTLSVAAQSSISGALGRDMSEYHIHASKGTLSAHNPRQKLLVSFAPTGAEVSSGNFSWTMAVQHYGYGDSLKAANAVAPRVEFNRVEYQRGELMEWYVNGPAGLEQGFTLAQRPLHAKGRLTIALARGQSALTIDRDCKGVTFSDSQGRAALRYMGLTAQDATGRELPAWVEADSERVLLKVDDRNARYPVVIDPFVQLAELTASDGALGDWFGYSVALSGTTVVVGAPQATVSQFGQGAVYVFVKPVSGWANMTETAKLTVFGGTASAQLGLSVATNGDTVIAGAPGAASRTGAAYVFLRPKSGWMTTSKPNAKLLPLYGGGLFGVSIAISGDTAFIGAPLSKIGSNTNQGATFVFIKPVTGWTNMTPTAALTASDGQAGDALGLSVATTGDIVVAGAYSATIGSNVAQGAAYVFEKPINGWSNETQIAKLVASDGVTEDRLGVSVSIGGQTIAAGAPNKTVGSNVLQGAVYVFVEPITGWSNMTQTAELTSSDGRANDAFGGALAVNGNQIVAGAPFAKIGSNQYQGAAYIYVQPTSGWTTTSKFNAKLTATDAGAGDNFGFSIVSAGSLMVAGAPGEFHGNSTAGAAYVLEK